MYCHVYESNTQFSHKVDGYFLNSNNMAEKKKGKKPSPLSLQSSVEAADSPDLHPPVDFLSE